MSRQVNKDPDGQPRTRTVRFKASIPEERRLLLMVRRRGHDTVSDYLRALVLEDNLAMIEEGRRAKAERRAELAATKARLEAMTEPELRALVERVALGGR